MSRLVSLAFLSFFIITSALAHAGKNAAAGKIITVAINAKEEVFIDGVRIDNMDHLPQQIQQRLWRSYMGNGKMPDQIHISFDTDVSISMRSAVFGAVREAQEKTLTVLCLEKYKKRFENTSNKQQDKLKKRFPVLFQQTFPT
jgi:hypothetical protein